MLWFDVFLQLDKEAGVTDKRVQRIVRLHLVELIGGQKTFTKRRHSEVKEGGRERRSTQQTESVLVR